MRFILSLLRTGAPSDKALRLLGATAEEVRLEKAILVSQPQPAEDDAQRIFLEYKRTPEDEEERAQPKEGRVLGIPDEQPMQWLQ